MNTNESPRCVRCRKTPCELEEYIEAAREEGIHPDEYVRSEDGTYNAKSNSFVCTPCYIAIGMPSSRIQWKVP